MNERDIPQQVDESTTSSSDPSAELYKDTFNKIGDYIRQASNIAADTLDKFGLTPAAELFRTDELPGAHQPEPLQTEEQPVANQKAINQSDKNVTSNVAGTIQDNGQAAAAYAEKTRNAEQSDPFKPEHAKNIHR